MRDNGLRGKGRRPHEDAPYPRGPFMKTNPVTSTGSSEFEIQKFSSLTLKTPVTKSKSRNKKPKIPRKERPSTSWCNSAEDYSRDISSFDHTGNWTAGLNESGSMASSSQSQLWSQSNSYTTHNFSNGQEGGLHQVYSTIPDVHSVFANNTTANLGYGFELQHQWLQQQDFQPAPTPTQSNSFQIYPPMTQQIPHDQRGFSSENATSYPLASQQQFEASSVPRYYSHLYHNFGAALSEQAPGISMSNPPANGSGVNRISDAGSLADQTLCNVYAPIASPASSLAERASYRY